MTKKKVVETFNTINGVVYKCHNCTNRRIDTGEKGYIHTGVLCADCGSMMETEIIKSTKE